MILFHRKQDLSFVLYVVALSVLFAIILVVLDEVTAAGVLSVVVVSFLPAVIVSLKTNNLPLKIFISVTLITQMISAPLFYVRKDTYAFMEYRVFNFHVIDSVFPILIVALFILLLSYAVLAYEGLEHGGTEMISQWRSTSSIVTSQANSKYVLAIIFLMIISAPIKSWMFFQGIGIVGVAPPRLPFHLSGLMFYLFSYIVPWGIALLYIKTSRNSLVLALIICLYSVTVGLASASKGVVLSGMVSVIAFAWLDKRYAILLSSTLLLSIGLSLAAYSRLIVHVSDGVTTGAFTDLGLIETAIQTMHLLDINLVMGIIPDTINRVLSFKTVFMSSVFNADVVGGDYYILLKTIKHSLVDLGHDAMHLEYLGYTIPVGFVNVPGSLIAYMLMASNRNLYILVLFVGYSSIVLVLINSCLRRIQIKYNVHYRLIQSFGFLSVMWFFTGPGTREFVFIFIVMFTLAILPRVRLRAT